jgi:hypothetical protein
MKLSQVLDNNKRAIMFLRFEWLTGQLSLA